MADVIGLHFHHHNKLSSTLSRYLLLLPDNSNTPTATCLCYLQFQFQHKPFLFHQPNLLISSTHLSPALSILCRSRLWDSNAESYEDDDDEDSKFDAAMEAFEEYIDSIWILKVFGSYGWMFPAILISLLLASGLKAFVLTMAIILLQSTFTFAFQRMQAETRNKMRPKSRKSYKSTKKGTSRASRSRTVKQEEKARWDDKLRARTKKTGYGSWATSKESRRDLGGWDELDVGIMDANVRPATSQEQNPNVLGDDPPKKSKFSRKWGRGGNGTPLLLRWLVPIFPFLDSLE